MNAAEEIQAAIETLERLKTDSSAGPWKIEPDRYGTEWMTGLAIGVASTVAPEYIEPADAELIVTLHRTIDAQLALLQIALKQARSIRSFPLGATENAMVDLARAINGSPS